MPVTVKIRAGWDKEHKNAVEVAKACEEAGAAAIAVHGRTRDQMYMGHADWEIIARVKEAVSVPVIGNGDVTDAQSACKLLGETGCDMVMVGRGALGNPWIFRQINAYLTDSCTILPGPGIAERILVARRHIDALCALKGEERAMREARKTRGVVPSRGAGGGPVPPPGRGALRQGGSGPAVLPGIRSKLRGKERPMKLLVLDGNSILNRAFYGIKLLTTKSGDFTNGIYGFLTMLLKLLDETSPDGVAVAFDRKGPTFRHKAYAGYKANRKGMPEELAQQMPLLQELLGDLGYKTVSLEGWEADDILGTLSAQCEREGAQCLIATGDRDSLQLVSGKTTVRLATTKFGQPQVTLYDEAKIQEDYGVAPRQLIDIKAIQGDSSDCIPGVAGIGPKGAGELIQKFGSVEYIYDHLEELDIKPAMRAKLEKSKDNAFLSFDLGTIRRDAPIDTDLSHYRKGEGDPQAAAALMVRLELFSLLEKFGLDGAPQPGKAVPAGEKPGVREYEDGAPLLPQLEDGGEAIFYAQWEGGALRNLVFSHKGELHRVRPDEAFLRAFFKNGRIQKYTCDTKPLHRLALSLGCRMEGVQMDTALAGYLLNPSASSYDVERLCAEYAVPLGDFEEPELRFAAALPGLCAALSQAIGGKRPGKAFARGGDPLELCAGPDGAHGLLRGPGRASRPTARSWRARYPPSTTRSWRRWGTSSTSIPPSSWERPCSASWACPTASAPKAAGPPMPRCWRSCAISTRWWTRSCATARWRSSSPPTATGF